MYILYRPVVLKLHLLVRGGARPTLQGAREPKSTCQPTSITKWAVAPEYCPGSTASASIVNESSLLVATRSTAWQNRRAGGEARPVEASGGNCPLKTLNVHRSARRECDVSSYRGINVQSGYVRLGQHPWAMARLIRPISPHPTNDRQIPGTIT